MQLATRHLGSALGDDASTMKVLHTRALNLRHGFSAKRVARLKNRVNQPKREEEGRLDKGEGARSTWDGKGGLAELKKRKRGSAVRGNEGKKGIYEAHLFSFHLSCRRGVLREDQPASFVTLNVLQPVQAPPSPSLASGILGGYVYYVPLVTAPLHE